VLIDLVREATSDAPDRPVVIAPAHTLSYRECLVRSEAAASGLAYREIARFGCALAGPADLVVAAVAAAASGSEICVYPGDLDAAAIEALAARFGHYTVLSDQSQPLDCARTLSLSDLEVVGAPVPPRPERAPVLILTTGTTGEQKGARHEWSRLLRAVRHPDDRAGTRWLLAYNLNQFAGIQILLHVLASRGTLVAPASRRADDVLDAIRRHRVTHISATPTFWRLIAGRLDVASARELALEQITLGGEAAPEGLIERLRALFGDARISHVYAGTEFGSAVSVRDSRSGLPLSVLERGADADVQLRIVEGELQIRSQVGMLGYHRGADDDGEWRATGDLVEVRNDRIQFVGRTSEIINVGGAKVHPLPVEELVCSVDGVQLAAVYGRPNAVTGQIVAADVVPAAGADPRELESRIRAACRALPAAARPRRIRIVDELATRGSKLLRRAVEV
jgi:acyl-CoA synthetase (AMP-forming)/AMP-acid ligase II